MEIEFNNLDRFLSDNESYREYVDKFKIKATTDDTFTPPLVFDAVRDWVFDRYGEREIVRPFFPGSDYKAVRYPKGCLVLDNPPFSILAQICKYYNAHCIDFFLFAPHLTLFNNVDKAHAVVVGADVVFENKAKINISFLTSLGTADVTMSPSLYRAIYLANRSRPKKVRSKKKLNPYTYNTASLTAKNADGDYSFDIVGTCSTYADGSHLFGGGIEVEPSIAARLEADYMIKKERSDT